MQMRSFIPILGLIVVTGSICVAGLQSSRVGGGGSETTSRRMTEAGWWPTKSIQNRKELAGTQACAACHSEEVGAQLQTSMAKAAWKADDTAVLRNNSVLSLNQEPYITTITRDRKGSSYLVARGGEAKRGQVVWAMGNGEMGQTFLLEAADGLFESQLSYFAGISGLDLTPGHTRAAPQDLDRAFGEKQSDESAKECFGCHTTGSLERGRLEPSHAIPGVTCEACHGPGIRHVEAMQRNDIAQGKAAILNPASFDPVKLVDYCGACHRSTADVIASKDNTAINVRFQPYRLEKSRCWSQPDPRIACTGCHNPHEQVSREISFYDSKCLACHSGEPALPGSAGEGITAPNTKKAVSCPVGKSRCASCHMPKYNVPQMHGAFTDHDIRIVKPGSPYPL